MDQTPLPSPSSPTAVLPQASPLPSATQLIRRLPRTRSRTHLSSRASLESIIEEPSTDGLESPSTPTPARSNFPPDSKREQEHIRQTVTRPQDWNGKKGITMGRAMRDVCGICFESAMKPNKSRCCGQLFCFQHLSDWLSAASSDGRCPTCRVPLSLETDTISLHPPAKPKLSVVSFLPARLTPSRRSPSSPWSRRLLISRQSPSSSSSSSSQEHDSDVGSSSTSESEDGGRPKHSRALSIQPKYESVSEMMSDLVPLREFGSLLSLVGCALVIGTLLS